MSLKSTNTKIYIILTSSAIIVWLAILIPIIIQFPNSHFFLLFTLGGILTFLIYKGLDYAFSHTFFDFSFNKKEFRIIQIHRIFRKREWSFNPDDIYISKIKPHAIYSHYRIKTPKKIFKIVLSPKQQHSILELDNLIEKMKRSASKENYSIEVNEQYEMSTAAIISCYLFMFFYLVYGCLLFFTDYFTKNNDYTAYGLFTLFTALFIATSHNYLKGKRKK